MRYAETADPIITLTTGPVNAYPDVLRALGRPVHYDYDPAFQRHYERVVEKASQALRIEGKALILHGDSDATVPFEGSGQRTHDAIAGSQLHVIAGGPHGCNVSHPDEWNTALIEFLAT